MYTFKKEETIDFYDMDSFDDVHYKIENTPYYIGAHRGDEYDASGSNYYICGDLFTKEGKVMEDEVWGATPDDILPGVRKALETFINGKYHGDINLRYR